MANQQYCAGNFVVLDSRLNDWIKNGGIENGETSRFSLLSACTRAQGENQQEHPESDSGRIGIEGANEMNLHQRH
jgi:hypothetical protein